MKLYLIRHGKTYANENHLYCGSSDIPLSQNGADELKNIKYHIPQNCRFITSGMLRTNQTLNCLFGNVEYTTDSRFKEIDFGVFELKSYQQLKDDIQYQQWLHGDNESNIAPEGESGNMVKNRVIPAAEEIFESGADTVVISHGGVIAIIMEHLFPHENKNRYQWQPQPGGGYLLEDGNYTLL